MSSRSQAAERHIANTAEDWRTYRHTLTSSDGKSQLKFADTPDCKETLERARAWLKDSVSTLHHKFPPGTGVVPTSNPKRKARSTDCSIYTGSGGNAYLHWKLMQFHEAEGNSDRACEHLMKGLECINTSLEVASKSGGNDPGRSFYFGNPGLHTLAAILYNKYNEPIKTEQHLGNLVLYLPDSLRDDNDELLFGRAGYLSCLLLARKHLPEELCVKLGVESGMRNVFDRIIESGQKHHIQYQQSSSSKSYLKYYFYGTDYLGAAHGTAGILYILLQFPQWCREPDVSPWIICTLDNLLATQLPNGSFPVKDSGRREYHLVHWCHGAGGIAPLLHRAHGVYGDVKYLKAMELALQCVWQYGLLKKGFGTCHGIAGNAYPFLCLYRYTGEDEYYYQAVQLARAIWNEDVTSAVALFRDPQRHKVGVPDTPYSLMEGLIGTVCFFCDLVHPEIAAFPGYDGEF